MRTLRRKISIDQDTTISSSWKVPDGYRPGRDDALILAHGAGNDMTSDFMAHFHGAFAEAGLLSVVFNFPYKEAGRKPPDRMPKLMAAYQAVIERVRGDELAPARLFIGGKSMGGRVATMLAAEGVAVDGLLLLGYPLHPAGKPEKLRSEHLPGIEAPLLFVQGDRDSLCRLDLLRTALEPLGDRARIHVVEGGDHSFKVLKRSGRDQAEVYREVVDAFTQWRRRAQ